MVRYSSSTSQRPKLRIPAIFVSVVDASHRPAASSTHRLRFSRVMSANCARPTEASNHSQNWPMESS